MDTPKYFAYMTVNHPEGKDNFIKILTEPPHEFTTDDCGWGFKSPKQNEPYGVDLKITFETRTDYELADNLPTYTAFDIYSEKVINIFKDFGVKFEVFEINLVDKNGNKIESPKYYVFHSLEGVIDALDEEKSQWTEDNTNENSRLVLDYSKFEHRPLFVVKKAYKKLMREDLKNELQKQDVTGFAYLPIESVRKGIANLDEYKEDA